MHLPCTVVLTDARLSLFCREACACYEPKRIPKCACQLFGLMPAGLGNCAWTKDGLEEALMQYRKRKGKP